MSVATTDAIRKTVLVDFVPAEAFELFTSRASSWWPVSTHSYSGDKVKEVVFEPQVGGSVYEVTDEGHGAVGTGARGSRRSASCMEWLIGKCSGTEVEVRFSPEGPGARRARASRLGPDRGPGRARRYACAGTPCSLPTSSGRRPRRRRRPAPRAARRGAAQRRARGAKRREQLVARRELLDRPPAQAREVLGGELLGCVNRGRARTDRHGRARRARAGRPSGRRGTETRAHGSRSTARARRRRARPPRRAHARSPPPPTRPRRSHLRASPRASDPGTRNGRAGSCRPDRAQPPGRFAQPHRSDSRKALSNGRSRHGTAAFAGEVEEDEERRLAEAALLRAELRPLAERAAVGLLADEADRERRQLERELRAARPSRRSRPAAGRPTRASCGGRIREPDPELEQLELLGRVASRGVNPAACRPPEVVAGVREQAFAAAETGRD